MKYGEHMKNFTLISKAKLRLMQQLHMMERGTRGGIPHIMECLLLLIFLLLTGFVIDFEVLSNYCSVCAYGKARLGEETPDF